MSALARLCLLPAVLALVCLAPAAAAPKSEPLHWTPAVFRGLTLGRSRSAEVLRVIVQPDWTFYTPFSTQMSYKGRGDHKGNLAVRLDRTGIVVEIQESFPVAIPRSTIYKELGGEARTARYSQARCGGAKGGLYRDPRGAIELTLYPSRGIALWPDQYGYDFAAILYLAAEPGASRAPECISGARVSRSKASGSSTTSHR